MENTNLRGPGGPQQPGQPQMPPPAPQQMSPADAAAAKKGKKEKPPKQVKEKKPRAPKAPKEPGKGGGKSQIILLVTLLVVAAGAAAYMFLFNGKGNESATPAARTMTRRNTAPMPPGAARRGVPVPPGAQAPGERKGPGAPPPPPPGAKKTPPPESAGKENPSLITGAELNAKSNSKKPARETASSALADRNAPPPPPPAAKKKKKAAVPSVTIAENPQETYKPKSLSYATAKRAKRGSARKSSRRSSSYSYYAPAPERKSSAPVYRGTGMPASEFKTIPGNLPIRSQGYAPPPIASPGSARGVELYTWTPSRRASAYVSPDEFNGPGRPSAPGGGLSRVHEYHRVVVLEGGDYYKVQQAKERLGHRNLIPEVRSFEAGGDTYYEVSVGHYTDKNMALNKANEIAAEGYAPRVVTEKVYQ